MYTIKNKRLNWYPNINNTVLIEKIANYSSVQNEEVQYFASSDAIHEHIIRAFVDTSDRVLIISPTYDNFRAVAQMGGAEIDYFSLDEKFFLRDKAKANALMSVLKFGELIEKKNGNKSTYEITKKKKIKRDNP